MNDLKTIFNRRYYSLRGRSIKLGIEPPKKLDIWKIINKSKENGFLCKYCGKKLELNSQFPYKEALSIDHKIPITHNGGNDIDNLVVCCHRCNIVKGTMREEIFLKLIEILKEKNVLNEILNEMFISNLADKIERVKIEKTLTREWKK